MGKLPTSRKVLLEDLKGLPEEVKKGIQPLVETVNNFMSVVYQGFNKNLTYDANIACFIKELSYKTPATYPTMDNMSFISELKTKASGVQVLQAIEKATYTPALGAVYIPWLEIDGSIIIYPIPGLAPDKTYIIRLLIT